MWRYRLGCGVVVLMFAVLTSPARATPQTSSNKPIIYPDEPPRRNFALSDGRTVGEDRLALSIAGGYPFSRAQIQFAPWDYLDMGMQVLVGYEPRFDLSYLFNVQPIETGGGWFRLAVRAYFGLEWILEEVQGDRFFFYPEGELLWGFEFGSLTFGNRTRIRYGLAAHKNGKDLARFEPTGFVELRLTENFTTFLEVGYRFVLVGKDESSIVALLGLNFLF